MKQTDASKARWARNWAEWRNPTQIISQWEAAPAVDRRQLSCRVSGKWWGVLETAGITLMVTREYEHLVLALSVVDGRPRESYLRLPHPSGLAVDRESDRVFIASTRNPNQVFCFSPVSQVLARSDLACPAPELRPLLPTRSWYYPGCLYLHDLAWIGGKLFANAVGQNAVTHLTDDGSARLVWWPRCVERNGRPQVDRNYIQLNSIAPASEIGHSVFSASSDRMSSRRPGHRNFAVDGRGVLFDGASREVICCGLTRPHSARLDGGRIWVDNSGYGEVGVAENGRFRVVAKLPGWTRGLCLRDGIAFVGTSRVIPEFRQYAPGLDVNASVCGVHAVEMKTGNVLGSLEWPSGNQIFAIDWLPTPRSAGFPFQSHGRRRSRQEKALFYTFLPPTQYDLNT